MSVVAGARDAVQASMYIAMANRINYKLPDPEEHSRVCLSVQNLNLRTPDGAALICRDLSFQLNVGERLLLVGPSGCGKSSLLRAISGLWTHGSGKLI